MWQNILFNAIACLRYALQAMLSLGMQRIGLFTRTLQLFQVYKTYRDLCASFQDGMQEDPSVLS